VANGSSISLIDDGSYLVNDTLRIKIDSMTEPLVRTVDNHSELMIPVTLVDGKSTFVIAMIW
jgi:hypothetical protein